MTTKEKIGFWKVLGLFSALMVFNYLSFTCLATAAEKEKYDIRVGFAVECPENDKAWGEINSVALDWAKDRLEKEGYKVLIEKNFLVPPPELDEAAIPYAERGFDLFYVPCIGHGPEMFFAAKEHPKMKFHYQAALLEGDLIPKGLPKEERKIPDNLLVTSQYGHLITSYLGGMLAGGLTKSNKIGFIGGINYPAIKHLFTVMKMGIKETNPNADTSNTSWGGSWIDVAKGKEMAEAMYERGVDVIMTFADGIATGASTFADKHKDLYMINSMYPTQEVFPNTVVADMVENQGGIMYSVFKTIIEGKWDKIGGKWINTDVVETEYLLPFLPPTLKINPKLRNAIPEQILNAIKKKQEMFASHKAKVPLLIEIENPESEVRPITGKVVDKKK